MVLVDEKTEVIIQGITGRQGTFHAQSMQEYGTNIVAGVTPGKGGKEHLGVPVFNSVAETVKEHPNIEASVIFVPSRFAKDAVLDAINSGLKVITCITEWIPVHDTMEMVHKAKKHGARIIGPNTPGFLIPEKAKMGIMPSNLAKYGDIAVITKSGTMSYEVSKLLDEAGYGLSNYLGIGGDPVRGTSFTELLELVEAEQATKKIVLIGEIGGDEEEIAAKFIKENVTKPVIAYIAGKSAPEGKRMGHAGAIISGETGSAKTKITALKNVGVIVANTPWDIPQLMKEL